MGIDPVTHKPKANTFGLCSGHSKDAANLSHMAQWESARLEAEARLVRESKLVSNVPQNQLRSPATSAQLTNKAVAPTARPQCLDVLKAWQGVVFNMFSVATDCLESPTSTLNFTENVLANIPAVGVHHENSNGTLEFATNNNVKSKGVILANEFSSGSNDWDCFEKLDQMPQVKERLDSFSSMALIHEMTTHSNENNAWFTESLRAVGNENAPIGYTLEGLSDILVCNSDDQNTALAGENPNTNTGTGTCGGNLEENRIYWNSLLNVLDVWPSGSQVV